METQNEEDDSTNSNNVCNSNMRNQLSKAGKQQQHCSDVKSTVKVNKKVISPVESRKCTRSIKADALANVKSQVVDSAHLVSILGKVTGYQEKICQYLDYLREIINDPPELEDINDLNKRQRRAFEFTNRFARNHLYQIGRMVCWKLFKDFSLVGDIKIIICNKSPCLSGGVLSF